MRTDLTNFEGDNTIVSVIQRRVLGYGSLAHDEKKIIPKNRYNKS